MFVGLAFLGGLSTLVWLVCRPQHLTKSMRIIENHRESMIIIDNLCKYIV